MAADSPCEAWCTGYNCEHESCLGCGVLDEHGCWRPPVPPAAPPAPPFPFVRWDQSHGGVLTEDGQTVYRFAGANVYWLMQEATNGASGRARVRRVLDEVSELGLNVVRTWAFSYGPSSLHVGPDEPLNEQAARGLDYVVQQAGSRRLRLVLPLTGYWEDLGGLRVLQEWCLGDAPWDPLGHECPRFYSDARCRSLYLRQSEALMTRKNSLTGLAYNADPTILVWEACNECRCRTLDLVGEQQAAASSTVDDDWRATPQPPTPLHEWGAHVAPKLRLIAPWQPEAAHARAEPAPIPLRARSRWHR